MLNFSIFWEYNSPEKAKVCMYSCLTDLHIWDLLGFSQIFQKKHAPHLHAHPPRHTHAHHAHTHDFMYAGVYTCTHCDRMSHLAKFCFDRLNALNFASKNVWVRKGANPHGPKKVWVPKSIPISFDVTWALTRREIIDALMVDVFRTQRSYWWMHHFQGKFWWKDHHSLET